LFFAIAFVLAVLPLYRALQDFQANACAGLSRVAVCPSVLLLAFVAMALSGGALFLVYKINVALEDLAGKLAN